MKYVFFYVVETLLNKWGLKFPNDDVCALTIFMKSHTLMMKRRHKNSIESLMGLQHARYGLLIDKRGWKYIFPPQCHVFNSISHAFDVYQQLPLWINVFSFNYFSTHRKKHLCCCDFYGVDYLHIKNIVKTSWLFATTDCNMLKIKSMHSDLMNKLILCKFVVNNKNLS